MFPESESVAPSLFSWDSNQEHYAAGGRLSDPRQPGWPEEAPKVSSGVFHGMKESLRVGVVARFIQPVVKSGDYFPLSSLQTKLKHSRSDSSSIQKLLCTDGKDLSLLIGQLEWMMREDNVSFSQYPRPADSPQVWFLHLYPPPPRQDLCCYFY